MQSMPQPQTSGLSTQPTVSGARSLPPTADQMIRDYVVSAIAETHPVGGGHFLPDLGREQQKQMPYQSPVCELQQPPCPAVKQPANHRKVEFQPENHFRVPDQLVPRVKTTQMMDREDQIRRRRTVLDELYQKSVTQAELYQSRTSVKDAQRLKETCIDRVRALMTDIDIDSDAPMAEVQKKVEAALQRCKREMRLNLVPYKSTEPKYNPPVPKLPIMVTDEDEYPGFDEAQFVGHQYTERARAVALQDEQIRLQEELKQKLHQVDNMMDKLGDPNRRYPPPPWMKEIKPPKFKPSEDPVAYFECLDEYYSVQGIVADPEKLSFARMQLQSSHYHVLRTMPANAAVNYNEFKRFMIARLGPTDSTYERYRDLMSIKQGTLTIPQYCDHIEKVANRAIPHKDINEEPTVVTAFLNGLHPEINLELFDQNITSLMAARRAALRAEEKLRRKKELKEQESTESSYPTIPPDLASIGAVSVNSVDNDEANQLDPDKIDKLLGDYGFDLPHFTVPLIEVPVRIGDAIVTAMVDTGSMVNLCNVVGLRAIAKQKRRDKEPVAWCKTPAITLTGYMEAQRDLTRAIKTTIEYGGRKGRILVLPDEQCRYPLLIGRPGLLNCPSLYQAIIDTNPDYKMRDCKIRKCKRPTPSGVEMVAGKSCPSPAIRDDRYSWDPSYVRDDRQQERGFCSDDSDLDSERVPKTIKTTAVDKVNGQPPGGADSEMLATGGESATETDEAMPTAETMVTSFTQDINECVSNADTKTTEDSMDVTEQGSAETATQEDWQKQPDPTGQYPKIAFINDVKVNSGDLAVGLASTYIVPAHTIEQVLGLMPVDMEDGTSYKFQPPDYEFPCGIEITQTAEMCTAGSVLLSVTAS